jgi:hypothetical protein
MANTPDLGSSFIRDLHTKLQIDPEWCLWDQRGFTWWGKNLAQRIWAEPATQDGTGETFHRVHACTDVFDGFEGSDEQVALLNILNHNATLSALVPINDQSGRVQLCCSMLLYPDNQDYVRLVFATAAALQAAEAFVTASCLPDGVNPGFVPATSHHPESGERHLSDEMLEFIELAIRPQAEDSSRYAGEPLEKLAKDLLRPPCLFASGSSDGVTAEFPHPQHSYMLRLQPAERHPRLGSGLLATLNLPEGGDDLATARAALSLNTREQASPTHFLGSWCATSSGLAFCAFFPNVMANDGIAISAAFNMIHRAKWHCESLHAFDWAENFEMCMRRYMERLGISGLAPS